MLQHTSVGNVLGWRRRERAWMISGSVGGGSGGRWSGVSDAAGRGERVNCEMRSQLRGARYDTSSRFKANSPSPLSSLGLPPSRAHSHCPLNGTTPASQYGGGKCGLRLTCGARLCSTIPCDSRNDRLRLAATSQWAVATTHNTSEGSSAPTQITLRNPSFSMNVKLSSVGWAERKKPCSSASPQRRHTVLDQAKVHGGDNLGHRGGERTASRGVGIDVDRRRP